MIWWLIFIAAEIARNYILIVPLKTRPHYGWSFIFRVCGGAFFLFYHYPDPATMGFPPLYYALFQVTSFYVLFDLILNLLRGKAWNYRGKNSGELDKLPDTKYYLLKAGCLVILILTSILLWIY